MNSQFEIDVDLLYIMFIYEYLFATPFALFTYHVSYFVKNPLDFGPNFTLEFWIDFMNYLYFVCWKGCETFMVTHF